MKLAWSVVIVLGGCLGLEDEPATSEVELLGSSHQGSSHQGSSHQGSSHQGSSHQGTTFDGSTYEGWSYQGSSFVGAKYNTAGLSSASISKTTITTWRQLSDGRWERRMPTSLCYYNSTKTQQLSCTTYTNLPAQVSPLAGTKFRSTFVDANGNLTSGWVRIGTSTTDTGAVIVDNSIAMHPLAGAVSGTPIAFNGTTCTHPDGCRRNSDLYSYDVYLIDSDNQVYPFCGGGRAIALGGTWGDDGGFVANSSTLTFACHDGTVAKCARWGYRPFGSMQKSNGVYAATADYHQACVRAAMADYCAMGHSFTLDGTLVDIYDYQPQDTSSSGFIPRTQSIYPDATLFIWESTFDKHGAAEMDFTRHAELGAVDAVCPGLLTGGTAPAPGVPHRPFTRDPATWEGPRVAIENTGMCSHDETTQGKFLHFMCSSCTMKLYNMLDEAHRYCIQGNGRWDSDCQILATYYCTTNERMARHSECSTGGYLDKHDTACTFEVCSANSSCCSSSGSWSQTCVNTANNICKGGREGYGGFPPQQLGFCGTPIDLVNTGG